MSNTVSEITLINVNKSNLIKVVSKTVLDMPVVTLVSHSLLDSQHIQLNETGEKVRANTKRCIVILREIPDSTPIQEIRDLFDSANCPKYTNCEFAHNNSWYVTFDSESDAQKVNQKSVYNIAVAHFLNGISTFNTHCNCRLVVATCWPCLAFLKIYSSRYLFGSYLVGNNQCFLIR